MSFLCKKSLNLGKNRYNPGDEIPDEVVLNSRKRALIANGYIAEMNVETKVVAPSGAAIFSQEEFDSKVAEAISEMEQKLTEAQQYVAELQETESYDDSIVISVKTDGDEENEQAMAIPLKPEEIQQVFAIMQLNADEGAKEIANVQSENVLLLLQAIDSRTTIKKAAEKQAGTLTNLESNSNVADNGNVTTESD